MQDSTDQIEDQMDSDDQELPIADDVMFECPNCGKISRDDVIFLCNNCKQEDLLYKDGIYMCPACMVPGKNFECMRCESKDVTMLGSIS